MTVKANKALLSLLIHDYSFVISVSYSLTYPCILQSEVVNLFFGRFDARNADR